ncbi:MAG TPA: hypothetical protein VK973_05885 [Arenicellales bacterium]|nr:hypothetical protein [Arenicellales bacterium]
MFHTYEFDACLRAGLLAEQAREMHQAGRTPNARIDPATDAIDRLEPDEVGKLAGILHMAECYYEAHAQHWWTELRSRELGRTQGVWAELNAWAEGGRL